MQRDVKVKCSESGGNGGLIKKSLLSLVPRYERVVQKAPSKQPYLTASGPKISDRPPVETRYRIRLVDDICVTAGKDLPFKWPSAEMVDRHGLLTVAGLGNGRKGGRAQP